MLAPGLRVLVLALELAEPIFSGNGVYGRSLVDALLRHGASVFIVCAGPARARDVPPELPAQLRTAGLRGVVQVPLPSWGRLDRQSDWRAWAEGAAALAASDVVDFRPDAVLAIDWTAVAAAEALLPAAALRPRPPLAFACFRVFAYSEGVSAEDSAFYLQREVGAMRSAALTIAISSVDKRLLARAAAEAGGSEGHPLASVAVLNPPLRAEIAAIANRTTPAEGEQADGHRAAPARTLLVYCGRLVREKNVRAFTQAVALAAPTLRALGVRPALIGTGADAQLVDAARAELLRACPDALVLDFLPPHELAPLLQRALLFVHPAQYESYGMMLVEAAALGAPLLLDRSGQVGAADLLPLGTHAFTAHMASAEALADRLRELLPQLLELQRAPRRAGDEAGAPSQVPPLHPVAQAARTAALGRSLDELSAELGALMQGMVARHAGAQQEAEVSRAQSSGAERGAERGGGGGGLRSEADDAARMGGDQPRARLPKPSDSESCADSSEDSATRSVGDRHQQVTA